MTKIYRNAYLMPHIKHTIGIDLTSPVAQLQHGMTNLVFSFLDGFSNLNSGFMLILFCKDKSYELYSRYSGENVVVINHDVTHDSILQHGVDALYHPFNCIFNSLIGVPNFLMVHDITGFKLPDLFPGADHSLFIHSIMSADSILTISNATQRDLTNYFSISREKIHAVTSAVDFCQIADDRSPWIKNKKTDSDYYIVYPAAFRPHKNHDRLLMAFARGNHKFKLILTTGETHAKQRLVELDKLITKYKLSDRVQNLGALDRDEYCNLIIGSSGVIFPSLSEGLGLPVLEGILAGKNVACSANSSLLHLQTNDGALFDPYNTDSITEAIDHLWKNRNSGQKDQTVLEYIQRFNKRKQADEYLRAFHYSLTDRGAGYVGIYKNKSPILQGNRTKEYILQTRFSDIKSPLELKNNCEMESGADQLTNSHTTHKFCLLFDASRLFGDTKFSGITKYIDRITDKLSKTAGIFFLPFYDPLSRGVVDKNKNGSSRKYITSEQQHLFIQHKDCAYSIAKSINLPVVHFSPYHPLPSLRFPEWIYCIMTHDVFHLTDRQSYPDGHDPVKYATKPIIDSIKRNDYVLAISNFTLNQVISIIGDGNRYSCAHLASTVSKSKASHRIYDVLIPFQNDPRKNFSKMIEVVEHAASKITSGFLKVHIFGKRMLDSNPHVDRLKNNPKIKLTLSIDISDEQLSMLYAESKVFLYLSSAEGFGLPPLEAMTNGCAPVVLDNTSLSEVYRDWCYLCSNESTVEDLGNVVESILDNYNDEISQKAIAYSDQYTWDKSLKEHLAFFQYAIDTHGRR